MTDLRRRPLFNGDSLKGERDDKEVEEPNPCNVCMQWFFVILLCLPVVAAMGIWILLPCPIEPEGFTLPDRQKFEGPLTPNTKLNGIEKLFVGKLRGPESMAFKNGLMYTGTGDGKLLEINPKTGHIRTIVETLGRPPCGGLQNEPHCGRPLGVRIGKDGYLYTVDAYRGLFKVDIQTGEKVLLMPASVSVGGFQSKFLNDLDVAADGTIYITDSSYKWHRSHHCYVGFENRPYGRVFKFDPQTNMTEMVLNDLYFANGIQLGEDDTFALITEMARSRVTKVFLKGPRAGQTEVFADNLPGLPDNIRPSSNGGYWVAFAVTRHPNQFSAWDFLCDKPLLRTLMGKIFHRNTIGGMVPKYGLIVELDKFGTIVNSLHDINGTAMPAISEVADENGILYIGSFFLPFVGRIDNRR